MTGGWTTYNLGQIAEIVSGGTPKTSVADYWDGEVPWATPRDLSNLRGALIDSTPRRLTTAGLGSCGATLLPAGSILLSSRAPIGHVAINSVPMATNQGFKSLIPRNDIVDAKFLYWWLKRNRRFLESLGNGATFKELSKRTTAEVPIELPPLKEQRRIASVLDVANGARQNRRQALAKLGTLTQAIFIDMFGDPVANPKGWPLVSIGDEIESATYGTSKKSGDAGEFPVLRMGNLTSVGQLDLSDLKYTDLTAKEQTKHLAQRGDVLFNRTNSPELVGKTAVFDCETPMAYAGYLVRLRMRDTIQPDYLGTFMNLPSTKQLLRSMCKSIVGMANINAKEVQTIVLPRPPAGLQEEFARRVEMAKEHRSAQQASERQLDRMFATLQQRAFRGDL